MEASDDLTYLDFGADAINQLPAKIVAANGTEGIDAVSGATVTSKAIFTAVNSCLKQAAS